MKNKDMQRESSAADWTHTNEMKRMLEDALAQESFPEAIYRRLLLLIALQHSIFVGRQSVPWHAIYVYIIIICV